MKVKRYQEYYPNRNPSLYPGYWVNPMNGSLLPETQIPTPKIFAENNWLSEEFIFQDGKYTVSYLPDRSIKSIKIEQVSDTYIYSAKPTPIQIKVDAFSIEEADKMLSDVMKNAEDFKLIEIILHEY